MIRYKTTIYKFGEMGEKTGWTYIEVPADLAEKMNPGVRTSYRVKGKFDQFAFKGMAMIPMGGGKFIIPLKSDVRKVIGKNKGAMLQVQLEQDKAGYEMNPDFMACLSDEPAAARHFATLPGSHQRYFSKWIDSAKTEPTKVKRIAMAVSALARKWGYAEMIRSQKENRP
jgi:hypothetical protein